MHNYPKFIVLYNIKTPDSPWIGKGVEFFDNEPDAKKCFDKKVHENVEVTKRPFYQDHDKVYLNVCQLRDIENDINAILPMESA